MDREGDLFFHITEAPVDVQLQDEVEFRVKYNQRSAKDIACQLVTLPKGTIVFEDVRITRFAAVLRSCWMHAYGMERCVVFVALGSVFRRRSDSRHAQQLVV